MSMFYIIFSLMTLLLFRRLMVQLANNHRSHEFIVDLVSRMFYKNTLRPTQPEGHDSLCATEILDFESVSIFQDYCPYYITFDIVFMVALLLFFLAIACSFRFGLW